MRILPMTALISALSVSILCGACATNYNLKSDYTDSINALSDGRLDDARIYLPDKETGLFIDLMERTYLNLLAGKPEIDDLLGYSKKIDNQVRYKVSRELKSFFYVETPEGYYASEHEIIWMHMLLSWGFSMRENFADAAVEARVASNLLSMEWSPEGRFDDPFMRVFLGCMWAMAGEWEDARVDFRVAAKLDKNLAWAQALADLDRKPEHLVMVLGGVGPVPVWNQNDNEHIGIRKIRNISFQGSGAKSDISVQSGSARSHPMNKTPDSAYWYKRHFDRNNEISDLIEDAKYGQKVVFTAVEGTLIVTGGVVAGVAIMATGVGLGGLVLYIGASSGASGTLEMALTLPVLGIVGGVTVINKSGHYAVRTMNNNLDDSDVYRFVRFLPEYAWVDWNNQKQNGNVKFYRNKEKEPLDTQLSGSEVNGVFVGFYPDGK